MLEVYTKPYNLSMSEHYKIDEKLVGEGAEVYAQEESNHADRATYLIDAESVTSDAPMSREGVYVPEFTAFVEQVSSTLTKLAETHLMSDNALRAHIVEFYADTERLMRELAVVYKGVEVSDMHTQFEEMVLVFEDRNYFIDYFQKKFERAHAMQRRHEREVEQPIATTEEYEAGTYREGLEFQVQDAVFTLMRKGYRSFESGFSGQENSRDQYIGFYTKHLTLPEDLIEEFKKRGLEITVMTNPDRTILNIHPLANEVMLLEEWKEVWDEVADRVPYAVTEQVEGAKTYTMQEDFRKKQDILRTQR
jgi:hypothetical protein